MKAIHAQTSTDAWLQACDHLLTKEKDGWRDYNIVLEIIDPITLPEKDRAIANLVDAFLSARSGPRINSIVNTIFPAQLYGRHGFEGLAEKYLTEVSPAIRRLPNWRWGTYAQRLFQRIDKHGVDIKPLETLVKKLKSQLAQKSTQRAVYELSASDPFLDIPIYDPELDRNRPIGGPCLTHLSVKLTGDLKLMLTGFYRSHFYIERALGNLFGLAHLQHCLSREAGVEMGPLICHSSMAVLDLKPGHWRKTDVVNLVSQARALKAT